MDDEQEPANDLSNDVQDDPFAPGKDPVPWFWLGLLLIPIFTVMLATLTHMNADPEQPVAPEKVIEEKPIIVRDQRFYQSDIDVNDRGTRGPIRGDQRQKDLCRYDALVGQTMTKTLYEDLKATNQPIEMARENGQRPLQGNPARVNIFLNHQNVITRVACG